LPTIPNQFRTNVEITDERRRTTFSLVEYFNEPAEEVRIDFHAFRSEYSFHIDSRRVKKKFLNQRNFNTWKTK
jgi:hypothetical protein